MSFLREILYEDDTFEERELSALVVSKVGVRTQEWTSQISPTIHYYIAINIVKLPKYATFKNEGFSEDTSSGVLPLGHLRSPLFRDSEGHVVFLFNLSLRCTTILERMMRLYSTH